ncbi:putative O-methyltransferase [Thermanaerovibrio velox DSM 12556]|uniref:Putative O-methyltransferase n=1 Tax=Thermanaerovibrio velox DSM 12556 TaxID=926567 RepID=H0UQH2_9BACT|nr:methyltransferase domain-containing protein [Thermanaerovibrio velox]EHM09726.1 putative O-methyltransferase [Thermanaerovibrio velox DSM 12556]
MRSTLDDLLWGNLRAEQPAEGFGPRVTVDTVLLGAYVKVRGGSRVLELGCAHGILSLMLVKRALAAGRHIQVVGIDIQRDLVDMALRNRDRHGLGDYARFYSMDMRDVAGDWEEAPFDAVVVNPPYEDPNRSRPSPRGPVALAVHGVMCSLEDVFRAASRVLKPKGRFFMVMRAHRMAEALCGMRDFKLEPKRLTAVHPKPERAASVFLAEAVKCAKPGMVVESPLFIYGSHGEYTERLLKAYREEGL